MFGTDSVILNFILAHPTWEITFKVDERIRSIEVNVKTTLFINGPKCFDESYVSIREIQGSMSNKQFLTWFLEQVDIRFTNFLALETGRSPNLIE